MADNSRVDWVGFYHNFTLSGSLDGVDAKDVNFLRKEIITAWSHLAQSQGLETALKSLRNQQLLQLVVPNLNNWDELVDRLDKRVCSEYITLGTVIKWFSMVQFCLCVCFLFPCLWPILTKYCVCRLVQRGNHRYLYVNKSPECGGEIPCLNETKCQSNEPDKYFVTSYMILHAKNVAPEWLPRNIKSKPVEEKSDPESRRLKASKQLFETLRMKLKVCEEKYQETLRRHWEETCSRRLQKEESSFKTFWTRCVKQARWLTGKKVKVDESREKLVRREKRPIGKQTRRTYSAILAREYEKVELINMHLPAPDQPCSSYVKESTSLFNLR